MTVKVIVTGPTGKMGKAMVRSAFGNPRMTVVGAVGPAGRDYIGSDIGMVCGLGKALGIPVTDSLDAVIGECDIVMDCTRPEVSLRALECCVRNSKAFVSGTTGFTEEERAAFADAGRSIPVILAPNTSRMINLMFELIREAAARIGHRADIDIIDTFDRKKLDAPSGTAKDIAGIVSEELGYDSKDYTYGREGMGVRKERSLAFNAIRSGGEPGSVKVIFGFEDEKMELSAHVYNMNTYADGIIDAALHLEGKDPGLYDFKDVLAAPKPAG